MAISCSDIHWYALPDDGFLVLTSNHPVAATGHPAIILCSPHSQQSYVAESILFVFSGPGPLWTFIRLDGFLVVLMETELPVHLKCGARGTDGPSQEPCTDPTCSLLRLRMRWCRWSRECTCGSTPESVQAH